MQSAGSLLRDIKMKKALLTLLVPLSLSALDKEPWLGNLWEFHIDTAYTYWRYRHVSHGTPQLKHVSNDQLFYVDIGVCPTPDSEADVDFEMAHTSERAWGFQSLGLQYRILWLDDIIGDPISLITGISVRGTNHQSVQDVNSPYHSYFNAELNASFGKEWEDPPYWRNRLYLFTAVGMANRGLPWVRGRLSFQGNQKDRRRWEVFADTYIGFGRHQTVHIDHFHGYANIQHRSIDIGGAYRFVFPIWGTFSAEYAYRLYAHSFPAHASFFTLRYVLPFSLF